MKFILLNLSLLVAISSVASANELRPRPPLRLIDVESDRDPSDIRRDPIPKSLILKWSGKAIANSAIAFIVGVEVLSTAIYAGPTQPQINIGIFLPTFSLSFSSMLYLNFALRELSERNREMMNKSRPSWLIRKGATLAVGYGAASIVPRALIQCAVIINALSP